MLGKEVHFAATYGQEVWCNIQNLTLSSEACWVNPKITLQFHIHCDSLPDVDVAVDGEPCALDLGEEAHHAVALHVTKVLHQLGWQRHPLHAAHLSQAVDERRGNGFKVNMNSIIKIENNLILVFKLH